MQKLGGICSLFKFNLNGGKCIWNNSTGMTCSLDRTRGLNLTGCRSFAASNPTAATTPSQLYELRVYRTNMADFRTVVGMFEQNIHLRTNHSELMGFWTAEIGESIHEVVHIWKYDSLSHRLRVRAALAADDTWMTNFIAKFTPMTQYMLSSLMAPVPGTDVDEDVPTDPTAVYTLQRAPQTIAAPGDSRGQGEHLIGRWVGILGANNTEYRLWRYDNVDAALEASWGKAVVNDGTVSTTLLYPTKFSPLQ